MVWIQQEYPWLIGLALVALVALLILRGLLRRLGHFVRGSKAPKLHPNLQKYAGRTEADFAADRQAAERIIATSSTGEIAGYELIRQVDAIFVEGLRSQAEAATVLKAVAAQRGANAIINMQQHHSPTGRYMAQGDAVVVRFKGIISDSISIDGGLPDQKNASCPRLDGPAALQKKRPL